MKNPYKLDIEEWKRRPFSWSQLSSWEWDQEQWFRKYILNEREKENKEMAFGKEFAKSIEDGTCDKKYGIKFLHLLQKKKEHPFRVVFNKIPLVGFADAFCDEKFKNLDEVKTGKKKWDQKRADEHGQIDMYLLMNYVTNRIKPEEVVCTIHWLPTQDNGDFTISFVKPIEIHSFRTKRTMADILAMGARINKAYKEMEKYAKKHE